MKLNNINNITQPKNFTQNIKNLRTNDNKVRVAALAGSAIGIASTMGLILHQAKKGNPAATIKTLKYAEKEMLQLAAGSLIGGLTGGLLTDKKENRTSKVREAVQQFFGNIAAPIGLTALTSNLLDKTGLEKIITSKLNNKNTGEVLAEVTENVASHADKFKAFFKNAIPKLPKLLVISGSLIAGIELGNKIINKVTNKLFKEKQKHVVEASDYIAHMDDVCLATNLLSKESPALKSITSKILPATFLVAGFKTGTSNPEQQAHSH